MDAESFDQLSRALATGRSRRGLLKALAGGAVGGAAALLGGAAGAAPRCKRAGQTCHTSADCCPGPHANGNVYCASSGKKGKVCQNCPTGTIACNGGCVDTSNDNANCGACGQSCPGGTTCSGGLCCPLGQQTCNGVCVDLGRDVDNCGACNMHCSAPQGATAVCDAGMCDYACDEGLRACSHGDACVDLMNDVHHCGACGSDCLASAPSNTIATCDAGTCQYVCNGGGLTMCPDGCVDLQTDARNCRACDHNCWGYAIEGTTATCEAGMCRFTCDDSNLTYCSLDHACVDLLTDHDNCGSCGFPCSLSGQCVGGVCN